jgi:hypothetical protein
MSDPATPATPDAAAIAAKAAADLAAAKAEHEAALAAAVEKARKQEKDKLYAEIESAKERAKKLEEDNAKLKAGTKPELDVDKIVASVTDTVAAKYEAKLQEEAAARKALQDRLDSADIAMLRTRLLSENAGTIIEDMVDGKTKEELESSLTRAKAAFAKVATRFAPKPETTPAPSAPTITLPPTPSVNSQGTPGPQAVEVSKLSLSDYRKNRQALLAAAKAQAMKDLGAQ